MFCLYHVLAAWQLAYSLNELQTWSWSFFIFSFRRRWRVTINGNCLRKTKMSGRPNIWLWGLQLCWVLMKIYGSAADHFSSPDIKFLWKTFRRIIIQTLESRRKWIHYDTLDWSSVFSGYLLQFFWWEVSSWVQCRTSLTKK